MSLEGDAYLRDLAAALAASPLGAEILAVSRGERDLVLKENPHGAGWIVTTAPKRTEWPALPDWHLDQRVDQVVGRTVGG